MQTSNVYWDLALKDFNEAIRLDPFLVQAYVNRGALYYKLGKLELARADWKQALSLDPACDYARTALDRTNEYDDEDE
jgi:tetratricopeptide (TPR) repeat protein